HKEPLEFDITAMVDLVFMMNIYFLVTFITGMGAMNLPTATHCAPLNADDAVIFTLKRSLDGKSVTLYVGEDDKGEAINDPAEQEARITAAIEQGIAAGKKDVLLKGESKLQMGDIFRIARAATAQGLKLHDAVMEKDE